jgi:hypothetical protein
VARTISIAESGVSFAMVLSGKGTFIFEVETTVEGGESVA